MNFHLLAAILLATSFASTPVLAGKCLERRYRRLTGAVAVSLSECAEEQYNLSVLVDEDHVVLSAAPNCKGSIRTTKCQECPGFIFHALPTPVEEGQVGHLEKVIHGVSPKDWREEDIGLDLGTFELGKIHQAYNAASIDTAKAYNLIDNNCATLSIKMARILGIDPNDGNIVKYVSRNLSKNIPTKIMNELIDHEKGLAMIEAHEDEDAVIEAFVSGYIHDHE